MTSSPIEAALLRELDAAGSIPDTGDYAQSKGYEHAEVVGVLKSLDGTQMLLSKVWWPQCLACCSIEPD